MRPTLKKGLLRSKSQPVLSELCAGCGWQRDCVFHYLDSVRQAPGGGAASGTITVQTYRQGDFVVQQGNPIAEVPVVCRGVAVVTLLTEGGEELFLHGISNGVIIGLPEWLQRARIFSFSVRAMTDMVVTFVRANELRAAIASNGHGLEVLFRQIGCNVMLLEETFGGLRSKDAYGRVIYGLLDLIRRLRCDDQKSVALPGSIPRWLLAKLTGLSRETASRMLSRLRRNRLIQYRGQRIVVPDLDKLKQALHQSFEEPRA